METNTMRALRSFNTRHGFTLVELLVAISMLAMVAVLGWRGLDGIVRARVALTTELEQTRAMQLTFAQMQSDCRQLASSALLGTRLPLVVQNNRLILARTVFADNQPLRLQVVDYILRNGVLTRRESPQTRDLSEFDGLWKAVLSDVSNHAEDSQAVVLQSHLSTMQIRLWGSDRSGWRTAGGDSVNTSLAGNSQKWIGLEVTLQSEQQMSAGVVKTLLLGGA